MNRKQQIWLPFILGLAISIGIFLGFKMRDKFPNAHFFSTQQPTTLQEVMYLINEKYVDDIDPASITDTVIQSMVSKLDPHSEFLTFQDLNSLNEQLDGHFSGIGIEFDMFHDTLQVTYVLPNGPAEQAGLKSGDQITIVDQKKVSGLLLSADSIRTYIKGENGTKVEIQFLRNGQQKKANIIRGNIELGSVDISYMIDDKTGYIRLNKFSNQTYKEFMTALMELKKQQMSNLILDLRDNGGGVLDQAIEIADEFLSDDKLITYTEGKHSPRKNYACKRQGQFESGPLMVLCNEGSASASEVLMGALQDWDRATIIGQRSFGKGLVQEVFELRNKSALKLTVARYYTPTGRCIQRSYQKGDEAYYQEVIDRRKNEFSYKNDSIINEKGRVYITPKGKKLYGGGGIAPDSIVVESSKILSNSAFTVYEQNIITPFSISYSNVANKQLRSYSNPTLFAKDFQPDDNLWAQFLRFAKHEGVLTDSLTATDKNEISISIKASLGKQIWGKEGLYKAINANDEIIKKAMETLSHQ